MDFTHRGCFWEGNPREKRGLTLWLEGTCPSCLGRHDVDSADGVNLAGKAGDDCARPRPRHRTIVIKEFDDDGRNKKKRVVDVFQGHRKMVWRSHPRRSKTKPQPSARRPHPRDVPFPLGEEWRRPAPAPIPLAELAVAPSHPNELASRWVEAEDKQVGGLLGAGWPTLEHFASVRPRTRETLDNVHTLERRPASALSVRAANCWR